MAVREACIGIVSCYSYLHIYTHTAVQIYIHILFICCLLPIAYCLSPTELYAVPYGRYVRNTVGRYSIRCARYEPYIDIHYQIFTKTELFEKGRFNRKRKIACGRLFSRKWGLGLPIYIKMLLILINIGSCTMFVLNMAGRACIHVYQHISSLRKQKS